MQRNCLIRKALRYFCTPCGRDTQASLAVQSRNYRRQKAAAKINNSTNFFFNYMSSRWLYNEHLHLSKRQLYFNINELCHLVAKSVGLLNIDIVLITKLAKGGSYRIFEATFRNGLKVIARLPYPCTVPRKYGVASEVATMAFLHMHGIPIPKILDWSSSAFDIRFPASGSLFFKDFLDPDVKSVNMPEDNSLEDVGKFCIGPSTEYLWWYQKRNELAANRGP